MQADAVDPRDALGAHGTLIRSNWILTTTNTGNIQNIQIFESYQHSVKKDQIVDFVVDHPSVDLRLLHLKESIQSITPMQPVIENSIHKGVTLGFLNIGSEYQSKGDVSFYLNHLQSWPVKTLGFSPSKNPFSIQKPKSADIPLGSGVYEELGVGQYQLVGVVTNSKALDNDVEIIDVTHPKILSWINNTIEKSNPKDPRNALGVNATLIAPDWILTTRSIDVKEAIVYNVDGKPLETDAIDESNIIDHPTANLRLLHLRQPLKNITPIVVAPLLGDPFLLRGRLGMLEVLFYPAGSSNSAQFLPLNAKKWIEFEITNDMVIKTGFRPSSQNKSITSPVRVIPYIDDNSKDVPVGSAMYRDRGIGNLSTGEKQYELVGIIVENNIQYKELTVIDLTKEHLLRWIAENVNPSSLEKEVATNGLNIIFPGEALNGWIDRSHAGVYRDATLIDTNCYLRSMGTSMDPEFYENKALQLEKEAKSKKGEEFNELMAQVNNLRNEAQFLKDNVAKVVNLPDDNLRLLFTKKIELGRRPVKRARLSQEQINKIKRLSAYTSISRMTLAKWEGAGTFMAPLNSKEYEMIGVITKNDVTFLNPDLNTHIDNEIIRYALTPREYKQEQYIKKSKPVILPKKPSISKEEVGLELKNRISTPAKSKVKLNEHAYSDHYTLIDSRWILTTLKNHYQVGDDLNIAGNANRIVAIEPVLNTELCLALLKLPVTNIQPVKRFRTTLNANEIVYYLSEKSQWLGIKTHENDVQSPKALKFHPVTDMTGFIGSGILVNENNQYQLAAVVTNATTELGQMGLSHTYQLTQDINTFIDNTIIRYALQY